MVDRRKKKGRKMRGSQSRGYGGGKKHRGAGHRGGRGGAGVKKHDVMRFRKSGRKMGRRPFRAPNPTIHRTVNIGVVSEILEKEGKKEIDLKELGYDKLLGSGKVRGSYKIHVSNISEKAKAKIEEAGGEVIVK